MTHNELRRALECERRDRISAEAPEASARRDDAPPKRRSGFATAALRLAIAVIVLVAFLVGAVALNALLARAEGDDTRQRAQQHQEPAR